MRILNRYVGWELIRAFGLSLGVFTLAVYFANGVQYFQRGLDLIHLLKLTPLVVSSILSYSLPLSVLTGCVICYGRLSSENEFMGATASGINPFLLLQPSIWLGVGAAALALVLQGSVVPQSRYSVSRARQEALSDISYRLLNVGQRVFRIPDGAIYAAGHKGRKLINVVVIRGQGSDVSQVLQAKEAVTRFDEQAGAIIYELHDVTFTLFRTRAKPGGEARREVEHATIESWDLPLRFPESDRGRKTKEVGLRELVKRSKGIGPKGNEAWVELHSRLALATAPLAFMLVGAPLGLLTRRGDKLSGFFVGLALAVLVYYPLYQAGKMLAANSLLPAGVALWLGNFTIAVAGVLLCWRLVRG